MNKISSGSSTTIVSWTRKLSLSILLFGCVCSPSWGQSKATESQPISVEIVGSPLVNNDQVKIRIKVKDADEKPVIELKHENFQLLVDKKQVSFDPRDWKSAKTTEPVPTWIIFLIDFSGSMNEDDSSGKTKLKGAIDAIRQFTKALAARGGETNVAIVPFGEPGRGCKGNRVSDKELDNFFPLTDGVKVINKYLDDLAHQTPCAATNIYQPLSNAINFLGNSKDKRFYVAKDSSQPQPKLAVVILSDGYDDQPNEVKRFQALISLLNQNKIFVHTLGYGLMPEKLGEKYLLNRPAKKADIFKGKGNPPPGKVPEAEFVDQDRLAKIAKATGGIAEFSPDAKTVAEKLKDFVDALLGEYEITYIQQNAERGSQHNVSVKVSSVTLPSKPKLYTMDTFGRSLPYLCDCGC